MVQTRSKSANYIISCNGLHSTFHSTVPFCILVQQLETSINMHRYSDVFVSTCYVTTANGVCLHLLVHSPAHNIMYYCGKNRWVYFHKKVLHSKKRGWAFLGGPRLHYHFNKWTLCDYLTEFSPNSFPTCLFGTRKQSIHSVVLSHRFSTNAFTPHSAMLLGMVLLYQWEVVLITYRLIMHYW